MRNLTDDLVQHADRRRRVWIVVGAIAFTAALVAIGSTSHPDLGIVFIALAFSAAFAYGRIHNRRTREGTDERAREQHRQAATVSWQLSAVVLVGTTAWMQVMHGSRAAQPYFNMSVVLIISYCVVVLWHRWRD